MELSVCVPTLSQYDRLRLLIDSLQRSDLRPDHLFVIDNGLHFFEGETQDFTDAFGIQHHYRKYGRNIGCAASWNRFVGETRDLRVISNDDILVLPDTLRLLVDAFDPETIVCPETIVGGNAFSCFSLPDKLVAAVGAFDEAMSPDYAFFEDCDYSYRLRQAGFQIRGVPGCRVEHTGSATYKAYTDAELAEHHRKFRIAQSNYIQKWGGLPGQERSC